MATTKATTLAHTLGGISSDISTAEINRLDGLTGDIQTQITTLDTAKAPKASPTFTGTVSGVTATHIGLGNVTNESKATMFTAPTFTGAVTFPSDSAIIPYIQSTEFFFGKYWAFSGGGTQTVFTLGTGTLYVVIASPRNYGGSDDRHGDVAYASCPRSGAATISTVYGGSGSGTFSLSGTSVQYEAGGGNPATSLFYIRIA